ncbi:hypothetical protein TNCV_822361 [Trichonephila clavipes]|nr:hypothetical protein TNCV_822361 [Trichonephila clavipes]
MSNRTLVMLLGTDPAINPEIFLPFKHPLVTYAYIKHMWKSNQKQNAFNQLLNFVNVSLVSQEFKNMNNGGASPEITQLLSNTFTLTFSNYKNQIYQQTLIDTTNEQVTSSRTWGCKIAAPMRVKRDIKGKIIFRQDKLDRPGGGLLIAVPSNISARQILFNYTQLSDFEILIFQIIINDPSFLLINLYASQGLNITQLLDSLSNPVFIFGDFNLHHPMWDSNHASQHNEIFVEWLMNSNFILLNTDVPTHRSNVGSSALLDFTLYCSSLIRYSILLF